MVHQLYDGWCSSKYIQDCSGSNREFPIADIVCQDDVKYRNGSNCWSRSARKSIAGSFTLSVGLFESSKLISSESICRW